MEELAGWWQVNVFGKLKFVEQNTDKIRDTVHIPHTEDGKEGGWEGRRGQEAVKVL